MAFKALLMGKGAGALSPNASAGVRPPTAPGPRGSSEKVEKDGQGVPPTMVVADEDKPKARPKPPSDGDLLDPSTRVAAQLAPPMATAEVATPEPTAQRARVSLEELVPRVLRRIAWGGDRTKGSVHLELTSGEKVTVHADGRRVRLEVEGNADLERRIGSRLRAAGIEVEGVR